MRKIIGELIYVLIFAIGAIYCIFWDSPWAYLGSVCFGAMFGWCVYDLRIAIKIYNIKKQLYSLRDQILDTVPGSTEMWNLQNKIVDISLELEKFEK